MRPSAFFTSKSNKKFSVILTIFFIIVSLLSSCSQKEEEPVIYYKDKAFIEDTALGWQERYDCEIQAAAEDDPEKQQELLLKACDAELSHIEKYSNEEFKKQSLKDLMTEYNSCLNEGKDAIQFYMSDNDKYLALTQSANNNRRRILGRLVTDYGLTVDEEYIDAFSESLTNAQISGTYSKQQETVEALVKGIKFEKEPDDYYSEYHTYSAKVKNTTGISFERIDINIKLYDSEKVVVDTESVSIENFMPEAVEKVEFDSDAEFEKIEVSCDAWKEAK